MGASCSCGQSDEVEQRASRERSYARVSSPSSALPDGAPSRRSASPTTSPTRPPSDSAFAADPLQQQQPDPAPNNSARPVGDSTQDEERVPSIFVGSPNGSVAAAGADAVVDPPATASLSPALAADAAATGEIGDRPVFNRSGHLIDALSGPLGHAVGQLPRTASGSISGTLRSSVKSRSSSSSSSTTTGSLRNLSMASSANSNSGGALHHANVSTGSLRMTPPASPRTSLLSSLDEDVGGIASAGAREPASGASPSASPSAFSAFVIDDVLPGSVPEAFGNTMPNVPESPESTPESPILPTFSTRRPGGLQGLLVIFDHDANSSSNSADRHRDGGSPATSTNSGGGFPGASRSLSSSGVVPPLFGDSSLLGNATASSVGSARSSVATTTATATTAAVNAEFRRGASFSSSEFQRLVRGPDRSPLSASRSTFSSVSEHQQQDAIDATIATTTTSASVTAAAPFPPAAMHTIGRDELSPARKTERPSASARGDNRRRRTPQNGAAPAAQALSHRSSEQEKVSQNSFPGSGVLSSEEDTDSLFDELGMDAEKFAERRDVRRV